MSPFKQKVIEVINLVPHGTVASYGQVAMMVGIPRAARQVGWILRTLESQNFKDTEDIPWWRIINNEGRISIKGTVFVTPELQRSLLLEEGIHVTEELEIDIEKYRYRPARDLLEKLELNPEYLEKLITKYNL